MSTSVMWFRRDLRLDDHPALTAAATSGAVVPLYVIDPQLWATAGAPRRAFLVAALRSLDASLDATLVVCHGDPREVVPAVAVAADANDVYITADHAPAGRRRDRAVDERLAAVRRRLVRVGSNYTVTPGTTSNGAGKPYGVFTPFFRTWRGGWQAPRSTQAVNWRGRGDLADLNNDFVPSVPPVSLSLPFPGEAAAFDRLVRFCVDDLAAYPTARDELGHDGTSRLSAALRFGLLHPRTVLAHAVQQVPDSGVFQSEIAWREFFADVLFHQPDTAWKNLRTKMDTLVCDTDARARGRFERWCAGQTGYPIVDAGMRQLLAAGWMHNRARMITASFLVKDLHLPWQWGARHFLAHLVDGDVASNSHGWQWVAGTGTDAAPFFRIFNPVTQGERFDPDGIYVRTFVPEVADVADRHIHAPWRAERPPSRYPAPIVDHARERTDALSRYAAVTATR
ncbi:MAG: deoxyribodipyrimidine photo-lyase [Acidimicrobiales bacterium]